MEVTGNCIGTSGTRARLQREEDSIYTASINSSSVGSGLDSLAADSAKRFRFNKFAFLPVARSEWPFAVWDPKWDPKLRAPRASSRELDRDFRRVADMTPQQMEDIIAFLRALTDDDYDRMIPTRVPSGLTPGDRISTEGRE